MNTQDQVCDELPQAPTLLMRQDAAGAVAGGPSATAKSYIVSVQK
jgi:hypothetical protein